MFELPKLPYDRDALEPHISKQTLDFHYGQHHATYIKNLNNLIAGSPLEDMSMVDIIKKSSGGIYNNAAQSWNHEFYWNCISPKAKKIPEGQLMHSIIRDFGNFNDFKDIFIKQASSLFGSGWTWLVSDKKLRLSIIQTHNADNPLTLDNLTPLLTCDVWEHAYYLDKQNLRTAYVNEFWNVINWDFVEKNYDNHQ